MRAVLLIGHGALNKASGAAMIRHAARLRKRGLAPLAGAGFLNFSRPTFDEALERLVEKGAREVVVQPYFLIDGYYVEKLRKLIEETQATSNLNLEMAAPFGTHPALASLVLKRIQVEVQPEVQDAVILMAHGTPQAEANTPIYEVAKQTERLVACPVTPAFMECNVPSIPEAIDGALDGGAKRVIAAPYFLQLGGHMREDVPRLVREARARHPANSILLTESLGYDEKLVEVIDDRVRSCWAQPVERAV